MKRVSKLLCFVVAFSLLLSTSSFATQAAETNYEETDSYVLSYNYSKYGVSRWGHFSPYKPRLSFNGQWKGDVGTSCSTFNVVNVNTQDVIEAYCLDSNISLKTSGMYRRINLNDSSYSSAYADKVRAVVNHSFPYVSLETMRAASGVAELTVDEAQVAAQVAIWKAVHGEIFEVVSFLNGITAESRWDGYRTSNSITNFDACYEEVKNGYATMDNANVIASHIEGAYNYLMNLEPEPANEYSVSGQSFKSWEAPVLTKNEDGTYDISITATVDVQMRENDSLKLTAMIGNHASEAQYLSNGTNTKTFVISGVPASEARGDVTLAIDGLQTVSDVFLFDAEGDRGTSQTLVSKADNQLPVHAEIIATQEERIINIHKTSQGKGLEGIRFEIYYIASGNDYLQGNVELDFSHGSYADFTIITDSNGYGSLNLTKQNLPDGLYLIKELSHNAIVTPIDPFYVVVPATNPQGTGYNYTIDIYPKNEVKNEVDIEKDVIELDNNDATVDAYRPHTWIISTSIPSDLSSGKKYVISDTLDSRLDFLGNVKVVVEDYPVRESNAAEMQYQDIELTEGVDYILKVTDNDSLAEGNPSDSFTISLTQSGMTKAASGQKLRIYFDAQINANAQMGENIPNQATLQYTNSVGISSEDVSDIPEVHTGGIQLRKTDAEDHNLMLANAQFQIYRPASAEELEDESISKVMLDNMDAPMILVDFFDNTKLTGEKVTTAASGDDGNVYIYGLAFGTYYLIETAAPAGYNLLGEPVELTINADSHIADKTIIVENVKGVVLPETGGIGTNVFAFSGMLLISLASILLILKKRHSY